MKKIYKIVAFIISFLVFTIFLYKYVISAIGMTLFKFNILTNCLGISLIILFIYSVYLLYEFILLIVKSIMKKSWKKVIVLCSLVFIILTVVCITKFMVNKTFQILMLQSIYIIGVITLPIVVCIVTLFRNNNNKYKKWIIRILATILLIFIYWANISTISVMKDSIKDILNKNGVQGILKTEMQEENSLKSSLYNFIQKMARNGYINSNDVKTILNIINNKKDKIIVNYIDAIENVKIEINNKEYLWEESIIKQLIGDFYKLQYDSEKNIVYIERYKTTVIEYNEKNNNIVLKGNKRADLIQNEKTIYESEMSENYIFDNNIIKNKNISNKELEQFKILLVYDDNNFIPYTDDESEYDKIKSYKVYSTGIEITLEDDIKLEKYYYTLRINRYNNNFIVSDKRDINYLYNFEPVVNKLTDWNNNTVLEIKFNQTYLLKNLKNVEIIFGYNDE